MTPCWVSAASGPGSGQADDRCVSNRASQPARPAGLSHRHVQDAFLEMLTTGLTIPNITLLAKRHFEVDVPVDDNRSAPAGWKRSVGTLRAASRRGSAGGPRPRRSGMPATLR